MVDPAASDANVPASSQSIAQPNFQQAMEITAQWLGLWEQGELSDEVLADRVAELVASRDGARGFFVVSLAGDCPLMDRLPDPVVIQLRAAGEGVVDLGWYLGELGEYKGYVAGEVFGQLGRFGDGLSRARYSLGNLDRVIGKSV